MRRKDLEITDFEKIIEIVSQCHTAHIGMVAKNGLPYVVAMNFGYERKDDMLILYFHSACAGTKIDILKANPNVFIEMDCINKLIPGGGERPCAYAWKYDSVTGSGQIEFIEDINQKSHALNCMIHHLDDQSEIFQFPPESLKRTCVFRVRMRELTGKHHE